MVFFFGGSFNPPHSGHRYLLGYLIENYPNETILISPNYISPFKDKKDLNQNSILELCMREFADLFSDHVTLYTNEIFQASPSYTYETILSLKNDHPKISLVIGDDHLPTLQNWHQAKNLISILESITLVRRTFPPNTDIPIPDLIPKNKVNILQNQLWDISSTKLRSNKNRNFFLQFLKPSSVDFLDSIGYFD
ncbi:nicotinate-nicotinamide nucleotide adenylyltransferase [Leptospira sp. 96542]|nr:nicotinate-nicotinamide nucleotide adenylyltransferase [Leptospira sp. 96542]